MTCEPPTPATAVIAGLSVAASGISALACLLFCILYIILRKHHTFGGLLAFFFSLSQLGSSLSLIVSDSFVLTRTCELPLINEAVLRAFVIGPFVAALAWLIIIYVNDLFVHLFNLTYIVISRLQIGYHLFVWGISLTLAVVLPVVMHTAYPHDSVWMLCQPDMDFNPLRLTGFIAVVVTLVVISYSFLMLYWGLKTRGLVGPHAKDLVFAHTRRRRLHVAFSVSFLPHIMVIVIRDIMLHCDLIAPSGPAFNAVTMAAQATAVLFRLWGCTSTGGLMSTGRMGYKARPLPLPPTAPSQGRCFPF
ncbi:hypothetical protein PAPYR_1292 [Paratrimastix pyriformis]|uniref:G-protein coupled receptors family 2 profile 2 domain-containing protein n=1 Tax=Paratrimastix pyriformis TaxID=342808 RepID=A0ABQ8USL2_9EUKA|nr:hypothetical protein PAPYR_1292 [Paratrimastix pyriformis]